MLGNLWLLQLWEKIKAGAQGPGGGVFQAPGDVPTPTTPVAAKPGPSNYWGLALDTCPGGTWYAKLGINLLMLLFVLLGLIGLIFGNKEIDKTVLEAAAA